MKILNPWNTWDFHMHSINFSDGLNTIDELVVHAGKIWLKKIAITDHSQTAIDLSWLRKKNIRSVCSSWRNIHNDVEVIFWVEWDIIDDIWGACLHIQKIEWNFTLLSLHPYGTYSWDSKNITEAYIRAIQSNPWKIDCIAHPCMKMPWLSEHLDIQKLVTFCNENKIPLELNGKNLLHGRTDIEKLKIMLNKANEIYVNSDAHTLYELYEARKFAFDWLKENGYSWE